MYNITTKSERDCMLNSLIEGFLLGIGAAIPIGPINILIMNEALISYINALCIGAGAMSADLTYLSLILLGFLPKLKSNNTIMLAMGIIGSLFLIYISYGIFKNRNVQIEILQSQKTTKGIVQSYLKGYSLTLLNPYTIGFWVSVTAYVTTNNLSPIYTILGLISAITMWITIMPFFIHKTKRFIKINIFKFFNIISSALLLFFGISMFIASIVFIVKH